MFHDFKMKSQLIDCLENSSSLLIKEEARLQGDDRMRPVAH